VDPIVIGIIGDPIIDPVVIGIGGNPGPIVIIVKADSCWPVTDNDGRRTDGPVIIGG